MDIKERVDYSTRKYESNNPLDIAEALGIQVIVENLGTIQGYYNKYCRIQQIHINDGLEEHLHKFVAAHELGHAIMHPKVNTPFLRSCTFLSVEKLEIEANKFAMNLLLPDETILEHWDYTIDQWSMYYGLPREIIELRFK